MLKKMTLKRYTVIFLSFLILLIVYLFPKNDVNNINDFNTTSSYKMPDTIPIYLPGKNNMIGRLSIIKENELTVDDIIELLKVDSNYNVYIPEYFNKIIPKDTYIIDKSIKDGLLKINFSKEFFNIDKDDEEKLIESLIYSLTELKDINKIMIFVEGNKLDKLPYSGKQLPSILDRSYGINKTYDLDTMKNIDKITIYYVVNENNYSYYLPVTTIKNKEKEKIEVIIEKLKTSPTYNVNLVSYLKSEAKLLKYEILENSVTLSFNNEILNLNDNSITEKVKYSIALSIKDSYNINETIFYIDNNIVDAIFI